jgi:hypothetical protein
MARIVDIQFVRLARLLEERKIAIKLEPGARDWLADKGWDPAYGARPLKRVIQKSVQDPLAELVLSGRIKDGDKVVISATKQGLKFNGAMGIVKTGLSATDQMVDFGDVRVDPGQVYADNVDFDDYVLDPACRVIEEAAFVGHRTRIPRQLLLDDAGCDHDTVMKLPRSLYIDAKKRADTLTQMGLSNQEMYELQDYVDVFEVYVPEANSLVMLPDPEQFMTEKYIKLQDYYGPKTGPYHYLVLTQPVPNNPFPIAPVGIWYDLHVLANRVMKKQMERAENQKTLIVVDPSAADQAEDMRDAQDSEIIFGNPDSAEMFSTKGAEQELQGSLSNLQTWFNYMSGNPDQLAGMQSNAATATQATILEGNASSTMEDSRTTIYDFTSGINSDMAWYLHYDPLIDQTMIARRREGVSENDYNFDVQELHLTPAQRRGEHFHYVFKIKPRSMSSIDPLVMSKRVMEFATNVVPALTSAAQICSQMMVPFNLQRAITDLADQLGLSDYVQEWFQDPEFQNRIALMMATGPQPEGKAGGASLAGVMQNGGYTQATPAGGNPMHQRAQELASYMQSAMKPGLRGTPGSRGRAIQGV